MGNGDRVNILLVDDQPAKLLSYEVILRDIDEKLIMASSGREALEQLLKSEIGVVLMDVCMPELDGFQLAAMIREHPRFRNTAIIFISAIHLSDVDRLRGYEMGAVDYVPIPVVPEVLRAKVKIFVELYRKSRQLEQLNAELEQRVAERTAELEQSNRRLKDSEARHNLALAAGKMGAWDWDLVRDDCVFDAGQMQIFGVDRSRFKVALASVRRLITVTTGSCFAARCGRRDAKLARINSNFVFVVRTAASAGVWARQRARRARTAFPGSAA
jgi:DNA-binding response OmpR family regulator